MPVSPVFLQFNRVPQTPSFPQMPEPCELVYNFLETFELPDEKTNHARFDEKLAAKIASYKEKAINPVISSLNFTNDEKEITAGLFCSTELLMRVQKV